METPIASLLYTPNHRASQNVKHQITCSTLFSRSFNCNIWFPVHLGIIDMTKLLNAEVDWLAGQYRNVYPQSLHKLCRSRSIKQPEVQAAAKNTLAKSRAKILVRTNYQPKKLAGSSILLPTVLLRSEHQANQLSVLANSRYDLRQAFLIFSQVRICIAEAGYCSA